MRKPRPTNKQIQRLANKLSFYDWTELELTELIRRVRGLKPTPFYLSGVKDSVEKARALAEDDVTLLADVERMEKIVAQIEQEANTSPILSLN